MEEPILIVEAKKNLKKFNVPTTLPKIKYSLAGVIQNWKNAWEAILQVQEYCVNQGARYALVTNGHQYIGFKAICERCSWLKGQALVLRSPEILQKNFTLLYEFFSKETISQDKFSEFAFPREEPAKRKKPHTLVNVDNTGYRNELYSVLDAGFRRILLDVPSDDDPEFIRKCYCSSKDTERYTGQLNSVLIDPLPIFRSPIEEVRPGYRKDAFDQTFGKKVGYTTPKPLFVLMGGGGVGKTWFLRWYFEECMESAASKKTVVVYCDFRGIACNSDELRSRILKLVIEGIISKTEKYTTKFNQLYEIFRERIDRELKGALKPFVMDREQKEKEIGRLIQEYQNYSIDHLQALVVYLQKKLEKRVLVVLDNMDQKGVGLQNKLYEIGQELVYGSGLAVIVCLREGTYRRITNSPTFNAFASKEFHVRAQPIDLILEKRFEFLQDNLASKKITLTPTTSTKIDVSDFDRFIRLIDRSLLDRSSDPLILECITSISNANIREQLEMIYVFLVSGQTKIQDYFWNYVLRKDAKIPFHEFLHSLIYEDHKFFVEGLGHRFMNVFEPAPKKNSSHFTCLRILKYLHEGLGQAGELQPRDFITRKDVFEEFRDFGWSEDEITFHLKRMATFGLVMPESGDAANLLSEGAYALTKSGLYYLNTLYAEFTYFSAMAVDTSILDFGDTVNEIARILRRNISSLKISLSARMKITERFIGYLDAREQAELRGAIARHPLVGNVRFVPRMIQTILTIPKN